MSFPWYFLDLFNFPKQTDRMRNNREKRVVKREGDSGKRSSAMYPGKNSKPLTMFQEKGEIFGDDDMSLMQIYT